MLTHDCIWWEDQPRGNYANGKFSWRDTADIFYECLRECGQLVWNNKHKCFMQVVQYRMQAEYGVETQLQPLGFSVARWVTGSWPALEKVGRIFNCSTVKDQWGRPVLLFRNEWNGDHPEIGELAPFALPPEEIISKR